jgi:glycosyltransferase involved in cell wall biosynthesis
MTIKKIHLFSPVADEYGVIDSYTHELAAALERQGVATCLLKANHQNPSAFLNQILKDRPDCTLSFDGLLPDAEGRFLADLVQIPHVAILTHAPHNYFTLVHSQYTIVTCIDLSFVQTFKSMNFAPALFLPFATSKNLVPLKQTDFLYDVVMLNTYMDYDLVRQQWQKQYGSAISAVLDEAAEQTLSNDEITYLQALVQTLDQHLKMSKQIDPRAVNFEDLLDYLETYVVAKGRTDLLQAIEGVDVHVFGSGDWNKHLSNKKHIHIHEALSYSQALECMQRTKLVLDCSPQIKNGLPSRVLSGLACGALPLALDTPFLRTTFQEDVLLYPLRKKNVLNQHIQLALQDEHMRQQIVTKGRLKVMQQHTWDQRAQTLIQQLPVFLEDMASTGASSK